ncbi:Retrovirus-related Pol polyprotein from transposon [Ceratobasidium sp. AG-Ba]|nr:Retrovirus-related Pol polyprotein from transposon [Ceratobasidium sp. AG-Ba]
MIKLKKIMDRPPGTSFLGCKPTTILGKIGEEGEGINEITVDSGSDITLISHKCLTSLLNPPKEKTGQKINLIQVTGKTSITGYVTLPLTFYTKQGPVQMTVEAYVVKGMKVPFILGNDFASQYKISISRENDQGTIVKFGTTGRYVDALDTDMEPRTDDAGNTFQVFTRPDFKSNSEKRAFRKRVKRQKKVLNIAPPQSTPVRVTRDVKLRPKHLTSVPIEVQFPRGKKLGFIERLITSGKESRDTYAISDCIINDETEKIQIANFSNRAIHIPKRHIIGYMQDAEEVLDKESDLSSEDVQAAEAKVHLINTLLKEKAVEPPTEEELELSREPEGGPKTAELPSTDVTPASKLLQEIHFNPDLTPAQKATLEKIILKNIKAFGVDGRLGDYPAEVEINLYPGTKEISQAPYSASPEKRAVIDKQVDAWLELDVIEPSKSPWGFPVLIVWRNGKPRLCIDYRKLNKCAIPDEFPLPKQTDILDTLEGAQWLTTLDALAGFTQLRIKESDRPKTAFRCHRGLFQFKRMPFGFRNGPSIFQRVMQNILAEFLWIFTLVYIDDIVIFSRTFEEHCIHLDKVLGAIAKSGLTLSPPKCNMAFQSLLLLGQKVSRLGMSTHKEKVDAILQLEIPKNVDDLRMFLGKMNYFGRYIPYLAWMIAPLIALLKKGVSWHWDNLQQRAFDLCKLALTNAPVLAYPVPGGRYRLYTDACDYGISGILQQVRHEPLKWFKGTKLYEECVKAKDKGKPVPSFSAPIPKPKKNDMTGGAIGVSETKNQTPDNTWAEDFDETLVEVERVIAYWSRTLKPAEQRYSTTEREALGLKDSLIKFQVYLEGEEFDAITDHAALTWATTFQNINRRLLSWGVVLAAYHGISIVHRAGRVHSNVDPLSRLRRRIPRQFGPLADVSESLRLKSSDPDPIKDMFRELGDNFEEELLKVAKAHYLVNEAPQNTSKFYSRKIKLQEAKAKVYLSTSTTNELVVSISPEEVQKFSDAYLEDKHFKQVLQDLNTYMDPKNPPHKQYRVGDNGLLYFVKEDNYKLCVPKSLQVQVVQEAHDQLYETAHAGYHRCYNAIASTYYWPKMESTIKDYIRQCDLCQKAKPKRHGQRGFLQSIPIPSQPFEVVTMDFITDLPESNGYDAILTIVDKLTKYTHFIPCKKTINEVETALLFHDHIWSHYGLPRQIITDRDSRWTGSFWEHLTSLVGIKRSLTTAYHPQADGQSEIMNQTLEIALRSFVAPSLDNWDTILSGFTFAYNTTTHTSTGFTPAYLLRGFQLLKPSDLLASTSNSIGRPTVENSTAETFEESMKATREQASIALKIAQAHQEEFYNKGRTHIEFEEGDKVLINPHSLSLLRSFKGKGKKLLMRYEGPFTILEKISDVTYRIRIPSSYKIHPVINIAHLEPYHSDSTGIDRPKRHLSRDDFDKRTEWDVEKIVDERWVTKGRKKYKEYLTRFEGFSSDWDEWLPKANLTNAPLILKEWELSKKAADKKS